jgi:hypothetical protein
MGVCLFVLARLPIANRLKMPVSKSTNDFPSARWLQQISESKSPALEDAGLIASISYKQ